MKKKDSGNPIEKIFYTRILELFQALNILQTNLTVIKSGNNYLFNSILGQLRAILTDSTQKKQPPLLFAISNYFKKPTEIFYNQNSFDGSKIDPENLIYAFPYESVSASRNNENQTSCRIDTFLDKEILFLNGKAYSTRILIDDLSNKHGGSHYTPTTLQYLLEMQHKRINRMNVLEYYIIQFTEIVIINIKRILKDFFDLNISFHLYLNQRKSKNPSYIIDFQYAFSPINISIIHIDNKLVFRIRDDSYNTIEFKLNTFYIMALGSALLSLTYTIDNLLNPIFSIYINQLRIKQIKFSFPFLLINDFNGFNRVFNRSQAEVNTNYGFGISDLRVYSRILNSVERNELTMDSARSRNLKHMYFNNGSYGEFTIGSTEMKLYGKTEFVY